MKLRKKLFISLLAVNFAFMGYGVSEPNKIVYAEEDVKFTKQRDELSYAVNDRANVVSSEAYYSYASENSKAIYEKAIADGENLIKMGNDVTIEKLAQATANINQAKANIRREVDNELKRRKLESVLAKSKATTTGAKYLLERYPNTVAKVRPELIKLIERSEALIKQAELKLQKM